MPRGSIKSILNPFPGGVREDLHPAAIPDGWLLSSNNWIMRQGRGRPRPGYANIATVAAADRITGIAFRGSQFDGTNVVLHTLTVGYHYDGSTASVITGTWATSTEEQPVRMVSYSSGGTLWLTRVNAANAMDKWSGTGAFQDVSAAVAARDITVIGPYLMLFAASGDNQQVRWNSANDIDTWPAANLNRLLDTPGDIIAGRALNPLSAAIYKTDGVYVATLQAAAVAFQFQFIGEVPGPLSPACLVSTQGAHYWLAEDYALYSFDGARIRQVSPALGSTLFNELQNSNRRRVHGTVLQRESNELWFWYPSQSHSGANRRGFSVNLQNNPPTLHPHLFADDISASSGWTKVNTLTIDSLPDYSATIDGLSTPFAAIDDMSSSAQSSLILGDNGGTFHRFGHIASDDGTAIAWSFEHPLRPAAGIEQRIQLDGVVSYWAGSSLNLTITLDVTVTDELSDQETASTDTFSLLTPSNHLVNFTGRGKWVKVKHSAASSAITLEHRGAAILGWPRAMV